MNSNRNIGYEMPTNSDGSTPPTMNTKKITSCAAANALGIATKKSIGLSPI